MKCLPLVFLVLCGISSVTPFCLYKFNELQSSIESMRSSVRGSQRTLENYMARENGLGNDLKSSISRLNDRLSGLESRMDITNNNFNALNNRHGNLQNQVNQQNTKIDKTAQVLDQVQSTLQNWAANMNSIVYNISSKGDVPSVVNERLDAMEEALSVKVELLTFAMDRLEARVLQTTSTVVSAVNITAFIHHIDTQLARLQPVKLEDDCHSMQEALGGQEHALTEIKQMTENVMRRVVSLAAKEEVTGLFNTTHEQLQEIKNELAAYTGKGQELHRNMTKGSLVEGFCGDVQNSYGQLLKEVKGLANVAQVITKTADNVLDTKIKVDNGINQIILEIGNSVQLQMKDLNTTVNKRFDNMSFTIIDSQNEVLDNFTSKIEYETSQVLSEMYNMSYHLKASAKVLDLLKEQTNAGMNDSLHNMNSIESKVGQIIEHIGKFDNNFSNQQEWQTHVSQVLEEISTISKNNFNLDKADVRMLNSEE